MPGVVHSLLHASSKEQKVLSSSDAPITTDVYRAQREWHLDYCHLVFTYNTGCREKIKLKKEMDEDKPQSQVINLAEIHTLSEKLEPSVFHFAEN